MKHPEQSKVMFELSYLQTQALFALKSHMAPVWFSERIEGAWETALMKSSKYIRK